MITVNKKGLLEGSAQEYREVLLRWLSSVRNEYDKFEGDRVFANELTDIITNIHRNKELEFQK